MLQKSYFYYASRLDRRRILEIQWFPWTYQSNSPIMAIWPHEFKPLSESERIAYRSLLYDAMLDIRNLCQPRGRESWNPLVWRRLYLQGRVAGAIADWLHNLAQYAATDFSSFDTDWFWCEYDAICKQFSTQVGAGKWMDYRNRFETYLAKQNTV
jgi:hypothetical protein